MLGKSPASKRSTFQAGFSASLLATIDPAEPDPTTIKSKISPFPKEFVMLSGYDDFVDMLHLAPMRVWIKAMNKWQVTAVES